MQNDALIAFLIFQAVFLFLDIYIMRKTTRDIVRQAEYHFFSALICTHLVYLVMNSLWTLNEYEMIHFSRGIMTAVCAASLACVVLCSFVFFIFTVIKIGYSPTRKRTVRIISSIPAVTVLVMILLSPWTGWIFSLDDHLHIVHGPLYTFMLIAASIYLVAVICIAGYNMATAKTIVKRKSSAALLLSVGMIIAFVVIDDLLYTASVLPVAIFAVIFVIFINLLESNINNDALTGMNNRRKADDFMTDLLSTVSESQPLYLFMCDLNSFKSVNDIYGHPEGDEALRICSSVLKRVIARYNGFAARIGGDEFLLSWQPNQEADPEILINDVNRALDEQNMELSKPYNLSISIGYAVCKDKRESLYSCIKRADEMLYLRKNEYYRNLKN